MRSASALAKRKPAIRSACGIATRRRGRNGCPVDKNESWLDAINIVSGASPSSELCMSIADDKPADGAPVAVQTCTGRETQWFRLQPWPPLPAPVS